MKTYTTFYPSPVSTLKVQCTDDWLTAVLFYADDVVPQSDDHPLLQLANTQLGEYFSGKRNNFSLPLQQAGTVFQQKVWNLLVEIPFGTTVSYQQLASRYGDVKAIRAVAAANGRNNLAIIVPCHRVIGSNQSLTGYAGGLWRKKWLLEHESKQVVGVRQLGLQFT